VGEGLTQIPSIGGVELQEDNALLNGVKDEQTAVAAVGGQLSSQHVRVAHHRKSLEDRQDLLDPPLKDLGLPLEVKRRFADLYEELVLATLAHSAELQWQETLFKLFGDFDIGLGYTGFYLFQLLVYH